MLKSFVTAAALAVAASSVQAATFTGAFWNATAPVTSIADAEAVMAGGDPTATFQSSGVNYRNGTESFDSLSTLVETFLGADAASLVWDGAGANMTNLVQSVFLFTGLVNLGTAPRFLTVFSDDGFRLRVNGAPVSTFDGLRPIDATTVEYGDDEGVAFVELLFFENEGFTGVSFDINGVTAAPVSPVPLPASLPLLGGALALAGLAGFRRRRS